MAFNLEKILTPRWSCPTWSRPAREMEIVLSNFPSESTQLVLEHTENNVPVCFELDWTVAAAPEPDGSVRLTARTGTHIPEGLYSLKLIEDDQHFISPNSVCICRERPDNFTFVHTTDTHLLDTGPHNTRLDNTDLARQLVNRINELNPAFVCLTGDMIPRYAGPKTPLPEEIIQEYAQRAQDIFCRLNMPIFIIPGNHDVAFPTSRRAWQMYIGSSTETRPHDFSFDYGQAHFSFLDGFIHYDPITQKTLRWAFTDDQLAWLDSDMNRTDQPLRFLLSHFDYDNQIEPYLNDHRISAFLYGHSKPKWKQGIAGKKTVDGNLRKWQARQVIVTGDRFAFEMFSY